MIRTLAIALLAGCFAPTFDDMPSCPDQRCPTGSLCYVDGNGSGTCYTTTCDHANDGDFCTTSAHPEGTCHDHVCLPRGCGDFVIEGEETCDDGNSTGDDGCSSICRTEVCGNGTLDPHEECDDQNTSGHDGCSGSCGVELDQWAIVPVDGIHPPPRYGAAATWDRGRNRLVFVSGRLVTGNGPIDLNQGTWEFDGTAWTKQPGGLSFVQPSLAYDDSRNEAVLFGGELNTVGMYTYTGGTWTPHPTTPAPMLVSGGHMVWDSKRHRIVLFGGFAASSPQIQMWTWDGTVWTEQQSGSGPSARGLGAMVYDPIRDRIVLFGGGTSANINSGIVFGDTWEYDGTTWTEIHPAVSPRARIEPIATFDAARGRVVVAFGRTAVANFADAWEYDGVGATWIPRHGIDPYFAPRGAAAAYDPVRRRIAMFGGIPANTEIPSDLFVSAFDPIAGPRGESCTDASADLDEDHLAGCADPDCWGTCDPHCWPGETSCDPDRARCGDSLCSALEDAASCPADCH